MKLILLLLALCVSGIAQSTLRAGSPGELFRDGTEAFRAADYAGAIKAFRQSANLQPASGTLHDLGLAEWHRGHAGAAILSWERSLWLEPFSTPVRGNLSYARRIAQL